MARHTDFYPDPVGAKKNWAPRPTQPVIRTSIEYVTYKEPDAPFFRSLEKAGTLLNEQQVKAVRHGEGPARVIAGAGSGKTRVLIERVAYLIRQKGIQPRKILMLTFANKTAGEMRKRLAEDPEIGAQADNILCGTFHSVFLRLIRGRGYAERVIGDEESREIIGQAIGKHARHGSKLQPTDIQEKIGVWKREGREVADLPIRNKQEQELRQIALEYETCKQIEQKIDYDDILLIALHEILADPSLLDSLQANIQYVLVDEFQDTSVIQFRLLQMIVANHQNIFVVGDPDQSIYRYAGAGTFMEDFARYYPETKEYALTVNYRSTHWIVELGNDVIEYNEHRLPKRMSSLREGERGPQYIRPINLAAEAELISEDIRKRLMLGQEPSTIAVLYRAFPVAGSLLECLMAKEVPINRDYLEPTVYERSTMRPIMANLEYAMKPSWETLADVLGSLWVPRERTIKWLAEAGSGRPLIEDLISCPLLTIEQKQRIRERAELLSGTGRTEDIIQAIAEMLSPQKQASTVPLDRRFSEDLDTLLASARKHENLKSFFGYVQGLILKRRELARRNSAGIHFMSMHRSKGLEFQTVYIIGASESIVPFYTVKASEAIAEECRLLNVAITRAMEEILISSPSLIRGNRTAVSPFILSVYQ